MLSFSPYHHFKRFDIQLKTLCSLPNANDTPAAGLVDPAFNGRSWAVAEVKLAGNGRWFAFNWTRLC